MCVPFGQLVPLWCTKAHFYCSSVCIALSAFHCVLFVFTPVFVGSGVAEREPAWGHYEGRWPARPVLVILPISLSTFTFPLTPCLFHWTHWVFLSQLFKGHFRHFNIFYLSHLVLSVGLKLCITLLENLWINCSQSKEHYYLLLKENNYVLFRGWMRAAHLYWPVNPVQEDSVRCSYVSMPCS